MGLWFVNHAYSKSERIPVMCDEQRDILGLLPLPVSRGPRDAPRRGVAQRGEGWGEGQTASVFVASPLTPALSPQERGEGARPSLRHRCASPSRKPVLFAFAISTALLLSTGHAAHALDRITYVATGTGNSADWVLYIAMHKGFLKEQGLELDLVGAPSTAAAMQQVVGGSGNIGAGGLTEPIYAIDKGAKLALLRIKQGVPPYSLWAKPGIKTFNDLRGKTVIVGGAKDITRIYFERMVKPNGLKRGDYDEIYAGTTTARYAALTSGGADAAILLPPFSFRAQGQGYSLLGRLSDYVKDLPFTGSAVNPDWALANKQIVVGFLRGYQRATDWFYAGGNRDEAVQIFLKESRQDPADVAATYDYLKSIEAFARDGTVTPAVIAPLVKAISEEGDLIGPADPARFVNAEIAKLNQPP